MTFENGESQALVCRVRLTCHYFYVRAASDEARSSSNPNRTPLPLPFGGGGYVYFLPISLCIRTRVFPRIGN